MSRQTPGLIIRCDGSPEIGLGHVMRCCSLALMMQQSGCSIHFVMQERATDGQNVAKKMGFSVTSIYEPTQCHTDTLSPEDLTQTIALATDLGVNTVLIDHYGATCTYFQKLKEQGFGLAVIDDVANRDLTPVDWLLNQNLNASRLAYRIQPSCIQLFGPHYALLRPQFTSTHHPIPRTFLADSRRILVTLGGSDMGALGIQILESLDMISETLNVRCIVRSTEMFRAELRKVVTASKHHIQILTNVTDMVGHMRWADLAVTAGGSTCWELCCVGTPMVILVNSEDQSLIANALANSGCAYNLGWWQQTNSSLKLRLLVDELLNNLEHRIQMSLAAQALVDGLGAKRVAVSLMSFMQYKQNFT